jgi:hypothetical protein
VHKLAIIGIQWIYAVTSGIRHSQVLLISVLLSPNVKNSMVNGLFSLRDVQNILILIVAKNPPHSQSRIDGPRIEFAKRILEGFRDFKDMCKRLVFRIISFSKEVNHE